MENVNYARCYKENQEPNSWCVKKSEDGGATWDLFACDLTKEQCRSEMDILVKQGYTALNKV